VYQRADCEPGVGTVPVEEHLEPDLAGVGDNPVHDLDRAQTHQVGVLAVREVDAVRRRAGIEHLVAVRQPQRVVAEALDLVEHRPVVAGPEPVRRVVRGLEAEPVDPGDADRLVRGVEDLGAARVEVAGAGSAGGRRPGEGACRGKRDGERERRTREPGRPEDGRRSVSGNVFGILTNKAASHRSFPLGTLGTSLFLILPGLKRFSSPQRLAT
jgi:hypothetical protein